MTKISFAQNREDIILEAFFEDIEKGFYVDIGANDPVIDSVTNLFYEKGWSGINIEPNPNLIAKLKESRPRDINEQIAVSDNNGKAIFRQYSAHGLSTINDQIKQQYTDIPRSDATDIYEDYEVEVFTLEKLFKKHNVKHIHFMKIDIEGNEYAALKGNDWDTYRPEMICIESSHLIKDWHKLLKSVGYQKVFNDGLNEYFVADESSSRAEKFSYADQILQDEPALQLYWHVYIEGLKKDLAAERLKLELARSELSDLKEEKMAADKAVKRNADSPRYLSLQLIRALNRKLKIYIINLKNTHASSNVGMPITHNNLVSYDIANLYSIRDRGIFKDGAAYTILNSIYSSIAWVFRFCKRVLRFIFRKLSGIF